MPAYIGYWIKTPPTGVTEAAIACTNDFGRQCSSKPTMRNKNT